MTTATSHTHTVLSNPDEARVRPSGLNARQVIPQEKDAVLGGRYRVGRDSGLFSHLAVAGSDAFIHGESFVAQLAQLRPFTGRKEKPL
jgi:hypothetical protein